MRTQGQGSHGLLAGAVLGSTLWAWHHASGWLADMVAFLRWGLG